MREIKPRENGNVKGETMAMGDNQEGKKRYKNERISNSVGLWLLFLMRSNSGENKSGIVFLKYTFYLFIFQSTISFKNSFYTVDITILAAHFRPDYFLTYRVHVQA